MHNYEIGDVVTGVVTGVKNYGVFILIDNKDTGLIHISEISKLFIEDINNYIKVGDTVKTKVINIDDQNKLQLSIKQLGETDIKYKKNKIIETSSGFSTLKSCLDGWISNKL